VKRDHVYASRFTREVSMADNELIPVYIMGQEVRGSAEPDDHEGDGIRGLRACARRGMPGGFCGACATVYRVKGDERLRFGLACQTVVQPEMYLGQIPFFPAQRRDV